MKALILLSLWVSFVAGDVWMPREIGSFDWPNPGFTNVLEFKNNKSVFFSCFDSTKPFETDPVYVLHDAGKLVYSPSEWPSAMTKLSESAFWPNDVVAVDQSLADFAGVVQTSGFIPPGKTRGQLQVHNLENNAGPFDVASASKEEWSYHWVEYTDVDGDGLIDILTARFRISKYGVPVSQFLALLNPGDLDADGANWSDWRQHVIVEGGPDGHFQLMDFEADDKIFEAVVASELWTQRVVIYYVAKTPGAWMNPENVGKIVVDENIGRSYKTWTADVDRDGKLEILCSAIRPGDNGGALVLYRSLDSDFRAGWEKVVLADGFEVDPNNTSAMAPGEMTLFFPSTAYSTEETEFGPRKPWIALAGDDNGSHYLLYPKNERRGNFEYDLHLLLDTEAKITGTIGVADLDNDGYTELIASAYSANRVHIFTYASTKDTCEAS